MFIRKFWVIVCSSIIAYALATPARAGVGQERIDESGIPGGICVMVNVADLRPALDVLAAGPFRVQMLAADPQVVDQLRTAIRDANEAVRISADTLPDDGHLPYAENMVNVLFIDDGGPQISMKEVDRVLVPGGVAFFQKDSVYRKPWPENIDAWTHYRHAADGNPVAQDFVVGPPEHLQWKAGPNNLRSHETDSSFCAAVVGGGRFYYIQDEATVSTPGQEGEPDKWSLIARDAFNGAILWKIPIADWGWRAWKDTWWLARPGDMPLNLEMRIVSSADGERLYATLGYHAPVCEIDGRSGAILRTFEGTEHTREILDLGETLILCIAESDKRGAPARVASLDLQTGRLTWKTRKAYGGTVTDYVKWKGMNGRVADQVLDPAMNLASDGATIALIDGERVVALDSATGGEKWSVRLGEDPKSPALWLGALIIADGRVLYADRTRLVALSAEDGGELWRQTKTYLGHLWYEWKDIFVVDGVVWTWSPERDKGGGGIVASPASLTGYDLATGRRVRDVPLGGVMKCVHHHRCYPNRATPRFVLSSRRGTEYLDLAGGTHSVNNWVRGTCHFGMLPAYGLQYAPPHPCRCFFLEKINGLNALAPKAPQADFQSRFSGERLMLGPAYDEPLAQPAGDGDWPTFRGGGDRYGATNATLSGQLEEAWSVRIGKRISAPTVAAGRVFVALVDEDQLVALDRETGEQLWCYHVGARIDSPPTYHNGAVLFGCRDGAVYSLRASDGALRWRFFAADQDRRINVFERLEAAQPVHGAILVHDGIAYFAAGRSSHLDGGIKLFALDAATGQIVHETRLEGPDYSSDNLETNDQRVLSEGTLADILSTDGEAIFMRGYRFDKDLTGQAKAPESLYAKAGMLDDTYFRRLHWNVGGGNNYAQQLAVDDDRIYLARMFKKMIFLSPEGGYSPGEDGFQILALDARTNRRAWDASVAVRVRAMAVAGGRLVAAGPPDVMPGDDPHAAFEGRLGGVLLVLDTANGQAVSEATLESPPVMGGIAVAGGDLFLTLQNGDVVCLGQRRSALAGRP